MALFALDPNCLHLRSAIDWDVPVTILSNQKETMAFRYEAPQVLALFVDLVEIAAIRALLKLPL